MRSIVKAAVVAAAMLLTQFQAASAQDAAPAPASAPAAVGLPKAPVPYTSLRPRPRPAAARPRPAATAAGATATTPGVQGPRVAGAAPTLAALPVAASGARLAPGEALPPAELEAFVDGLVKDAMSREHIAGVTVSVVQNGQVVLKKGYGFADLNPQRRVDPDRTLFRIGSISKTFTWITLMKEVEAGRIVLDRPINLYLPERVQVRDQGFSAPVRVRNLMDHSPGFEDRALGHLMERDFDRVRPLELYLRQERPRRVHAPGAVASYSNYGAALAGEAVAYVSGKTFERQVEEEILLPLAMGRTTFREPHAEKAGLPGPMPANLAPDISQGYRWTPTGFKQRDYEYIAQLAPAGSASSTAGDMSRYMLMLLNGGQLGGVSIYSPRTAQAFRTPLRRTPPGINGWAHGFQIYDLPGGYRGYGHGGATLSFMSNMVTVPQLGLGVFISTNTESGQALAARFPDRVIAHFYASPQPFPRPGSPALVEDRAAFEGYYVSTRRTYGGLEGFVGLLMEGAEVSVTPDGHLVTARDDSVKTWVPDGAPQAGRFVATDGAERIAFIMDGAKARAFQTASGAGLMERASFWMRPSTLGILAALTAAASLATLGGLALRNRREFRQNAIQSHASLGQNIQALLWLTSMVLFGVWASKTGDVAQVMYRWPGALLVTASACALVSAVLTALTLIAFPAVLRGGRRVDSWSHLRKAFFSVTVAIYLAFSVVLVLWGAIFPWSG